MSDLVPKEYKCKIAFIGLVLSLVSILVINLLEFVLGQAVPRKIVFCSYTPSGDEILHCALGNE